MRMLLATVIVMGSSGAVAAQPKHVSNVHDTAKGPSSEESELQRLEKFFAEAKKTRFNPRPVRRNLLGSFNRNSPQPLRREIAQPSNSVWPPVEAMDGLLDELESRGEVSWDTEREFWRTVLTALSDENMRKDKRDALLSQMKPRTRRLHVLEWTILAARLEQLVAARERVRAGKALYEGGQATVALVLEGGLMRLEAEVALAENLLDMFPCENEELKQRVLLEFKLRAAREAYSNNLTTWAVTYTLLSGGKGTKVVETRARTAVYRSLAALRTFQLRLEKQDRTD